MKSHSFIPLRLFLVFPFVLFFLFLIHRLIKDIFFIFKDHRFFLFIFPKFFFVIIHKTLAYSNLFFQSLFFFFHFELIFHFQVQLLLFLLINYLFTFLNLFHFSFLFISQTPIYLLIFFITIIFI